MDHRSALILAASLLCGSAHAFYAQASAPTGFTAGAINTYNAAKAGATASIELGKIAANAALNTGGKTVSIATKIPMAANAARVIAAAIYLHPAVRTAVVVAGWLGAGKLLYDSSKGWLEQKNAEAGSYYAGGYGPYSTPEAACEAYVTAVVNSTYTYSHIEPNGSTQWHCYYKSKSGSGSPSMMGDGVSKRGTELNCPPGWTKDGSLCYSPALSQPEFVDRLAAKPMPDAVPQHVPVDFPVDVPYIEPIFVPTGNPVKNPNYDPSKPQTGENLPYVQPGVKIEAANDAKNPFQVNLQPVNRPVDNPVGSKDPVPSTDPGGSGNNDKPREDERDLCEKHPDILACQKLDEPEDPGKLKVQEVDFNFQPESGFAGSASCPAPMSFNVHGNIINISWQPFCNSLDMIKPFLLAMAWLSAAFIMLGTRRE